MRTNKRTLGIVFLAIAFMLCSILFVGSVSPKTAKAEDEPTLVVSEVTANPGDTVDITLSITANPGISSFKFKVTYDSELTLTAVEFDENLGGTSSTSPYETNGSPATVTWVAGAGDDDVTLTTALVTLTFDVSEEAEVGEYEAVFVTYDSEDVYNSDEQNVALAIENGGVYLSSTVGGDVNGDGKANNKDITRLIQYLSDWEVEVNEEAMDVNGDGKTNNKDITRLIQFLSDWDVEVCVTMPNKVTFDANGGTLVSGKAVQMVKTGEDAVAPTFEREGYTFIGFDVDYTDISESIVVTAQWEASAHTCVFDQEVAEPQFLKSAATCTAKAVYYKSCTCGEMSTEETFEYGDKLEHTYNQKVATGKYLKSSATSTQKAVYYYSCACGAVGTETFEYGDYFAQYVYDKSAGSTYALAKDIQNAKVTVNGKLVSSAVVAESKVKLPAGLSVTAGEIATVVVSGTVNSKADSVTFYVEVIKKADVYINSAEDFNDWYNIANYSETYNSNQYVLLTANIDLAEYAYGWVNSATYGSERNAMNFNGTFNGQGFNIDNFTTYYGFMSLDAEGTIKNVSFTNVYNTNVQWGGGFFAKTILGTVSNVYYSGTFKTGTAGTSTGIVYQCHNAVCVENFVVVLKADEEIATPEVGYGIAAYSTNWPSMYVVNEVLNTATESTLVGAGVTNTSKYNFYESLDEFSATILELPEGFSSDMWVIDENYGLMFANSYLENKIMNNYFDAIYNSTNTNTSGTYEAIYSAELGLDVYSKEFTESTMFVANYNNLVDKGFKGWSFAIMSTEDTSLIYENAVKLKANTWYYIHVAVETANLTVNKVSYPDWTVGQVYISESQYGEYTKVTLADAYLKNTAYTSQPAQFTSPKSGTYPMTIYMTNIYVNETEYEDASAIAKDNVTFTKGNVSDVIFSVLDAQTFDKLYIDGVESSADVTIDNNLVVISGSAFSSLASGSYAVKVVTDINVYTFNVTIADVIISSAEDFENWYGIENYSEAYDDNQYVVLTANIDLAGKNFGWVNSTIYGSERSEMRFNGTFDGQGYNIDNFTTYYGFMSLTAEGTIKNVSFTNVYNTGVAYGGGFFAKNVFGTISNVYYSGTYKTGAATSTSGIMYQCNTAVKIENFVVVVNASETVTTPANGHGFACYAKNSSSMYIVNEVMNPSAGSPIVTNGVAAIDNFYESIDEFSACVMDLPAGFSSDMWVIDETYGLMMKNSYATITYDNNYFEELLNYGNNSSTVKDATLDTTYDIGMPVYKKTGSNASTFYDNYNNLKEAGYTEWSFALMTTVDTSIIYKDAIKLSAETWYYFHVVVEDYEYNSTIYQVGQVYVSTSQYGTYAKQNLNGAYLTNNGTGASTYTCCLNNLIHFVTGTDFDVYMTDVYVNSAYEATETVTLDNVAMQVDNATPVTFNLTSTQVLEGLYIDGVESDVKATISNGKVTIPADAFTGLAVGEYAVKVQTNKFAYTFNLIVADVVINSAEDFNTWYSNLSANYAASQYVVLNANIDLSAYSYYSTDTTAMNFNGTFDGQGYNIDNFTTGYGFMSVAAEGTIKNVSFTNVYHKNMRWSYGFFAKQIFGTLSNVYYSGTAADFTATGYDKNGADVNGTAGIIYQCNTAVKIENFVVVLKQGSTTVTKPEYGCGFAAYAKNSSSMYIVNELMNESTGSSIVRAGVSEIDNFYGSANTFVSTVNTLPAGFSSDIWTYDKALGLVFKSTIIDNNYFEEDSLLDYGKNSSTVKDATVDTTYDIGLTVYKKAGSNAATFYDNYNNLKEAGYTEWSFALMTTVDTSIIYENAIKLKANTWYFFHVVVEDYNYNSNDYQVGQVYVSTSQYGTYVKQNLNGGYLTAGSGASVYTCCLNNLIHFVTGDTPFDVYMTDVYAK